MKRAPIADRELTKLKEQLRIRERQVALAVRALKDIARFKSAPLSVFSSEVQWLQRRAMQGLVQTENVQRKKPLIVPMPGTPYPRIARTVPDHEEKQPWDDE